MKINDKYKLMEILNEPFIVEEEYRNFNIKKGSSVKNKIIFDTSKNPTVFSDIPKMMADQILESLNIKYIHEVFYGGTGLLIYPYLGKKFFFLDRNSHLILKIKAPDYSCCILNIINGQLSKTSSFEFKSLENLYNNHQEKEVDYEVFFVDITNKVITEIHLLKRYMEREMSQAIRSIGYSAESLEISRILKDKDNCQQKIKKLFFKLVLIGCEKIENESIYDLKEDNSLMFNRINSILDSIMVKSQKPEIFNNLYLSSKILYNFTGLDNNEMSEFENLRSLVKEVEEYRLYLKEITK